jgi:hypothetical protein
LTVTEFEDKEEQGLEFQHIRARIRITLSLPIDDLGKPSGAPTNPNMYTSRLGEPKEDLVTIFRRMLDLGTPEYEHELAGFLHNGRPKLRYEPVKTEIEGTKTWTFIDHAHATTKANEAEYFEERRKENERRARIADKIKTLVVTKKEDIIISSSHADGSYDFQCYTIGCPFVTNDKKDYERHVVILHYGKGLCYPGKIDIKMRGWTAQGRKWEI